MPSKPLDILFFDAAQTLMVPHPGVGESYAALAREFGVEVEPRAVTLAFAQAWRKGRSAAVGAPYGRTSGESRAFWRAVVADVFARVGSAMPGDPFFDCLYDGFATARCWRVPDDVLPAIELARRSGIPIGVLSNFDTRMRPLLDDLRLSPLFDVIVVSCDVGAEKPDRFIFDEALRRAGLPPTASAGLVGDSVANDYAGCVGAGWEFCLVDREGRNTDVSIPTRRNLVEAVEVLLA